MDGDSWLLLILFFFFVFGASYFACAESAFSSMNKVRVRGMAEDGDRRAKTAVYISDHFDDALTTILICTNITHIAAASVATVLAVSLWHDLANIGLYCTLVTTAIVFLFSEMIPKALANDRSDTMALRSASSLRFFMKLMKPLVFIFGSMASWTKKRFGRNDQPSITEEEFYEIIDTIEEEGVVDEEQTDLLKSAMDFSDTTAGDVMTMREDIFWLDMNSSKREMLDRLKTTNHSRIPVVDGELDRLIGVLQLRWFLKNYTDHRDEPIRRYIRKNLTKPYYIRKDAKIDELLETMRQHKIYLAFVVDDQRHILGIVTIEDFLEELVGEIWDEDDVVDERFFSLGGNRFEADASLTVAEVFRRMKRPLRGTPLAGHASQTMRQWVLDSFKEPPEEEDSFFEGGYEISVEEEDEDNLITRVIIRICDPNDPEDGKRVIS